MGVPHYREVVPCTEAVLFSEVWRYGVGIPYREVVPCTKVVLFSEVLGHRVSHKGNKINKDRDSVVFTTVNGSLLVPLL